jgi:predicted nucleotidyltransferase
MNLSTHDSDDVADPISHLKESEKKIIRGMIRQHPEITRALIFGSRARGTANQGSDVDIALVGNIDLDIISSVKRELEEGTGLPYFFDIVQYSTITDEALKKEIDEQSIVFFER